MIALLACWFVSSALAGSVSGPVDASDADAPPVAAPDRSAPPAVVDPVLLDRPEPTVVALGDGLTLHHVRVPGVRKVVVTLRLQRGSLELNGAHDAVANALSYVFDEASLDYSAEQLAELSDGREINVSARLSMHSAGGELVAPVGALEEGMAVLTSVFTRPKLDKKDVKRWVRDQQLYLTKLGPSNNRAIAANLLAWGSYTADHPYGRRPDLKALAKVKPAALAALHQRVVRGAPGVITVVGDIDFETAQAAVQGLAAVVGASSGEPSYPEVPPLTGSRVLAADLPGNAQAMIMLRLNGPNRTHADRVAAVATDWALGGHFMSRLNANLREDKGYTYGSNSRLTLGERGGMWDITVDVKGENAGATIREIEAELARLAGDGPTAEEIDMSWRESVSYWNDAYRSASSASAPYTALVHPAESMADRRARIDALRQLAPADAAVVSQRWLAADQPRLWVIVGDRATLEPQLAELGISTTWVTPADALLGNL